MEKLIELLDLYRMRISPIWKMFAYATCYKQWAYWFTL